MSRDLVLIIEFVLIGNMVLTKKRFLVILLGVSVVCATKRDATTCGSLPIKKPLMARHIGSPVWFGVGDIMKFNCENGQVTKPLYKLKGVMKIECEQEGWSSKPPRCVAKACSDVGPSVPNAQLLKTIIAGGTNDFGTTISYICNLGFKIGSGNSAKTCQKTGYWEGNVTCVDVVCPRPFIYNGNVTYDLLSYGSQANYSCDKGYLLSSQSIRICGMNGKWSGDAPKCKLLCPQLSSPVNGYIKSTKRYQEFRFVGAEVEFECNLNYRMRGSEMRVCLSDGRWSGTQPKCVINTCGRPGPFSNGVMTSSLPGYIIGTVVRFRCHPGYQLIGSETQRTCMKDGHWTGTKNPTCKVTFCEEPGIIRYGSHNNMPQNGLYPYESTVTYTCTSQYYLWGNATVKCQAINSDTPYWSGLVPTCLTLSGFDEECVRQKGKFKAVQGHPHCIFPVTPTISLAGQRKGNTELDTLTIVTASAGSTLGALVILLSVMVFVRRFHRNRRFRNHSIRSRFYSDDDHVTLIATYRGDVHFSLPSYDEAMSQVQRDPPPFESVVQTNGTGPTNNNSTLLAITDGNSSNPELGSNTDNSSAHARNENSADQQINVVSNPMNENSSGGTSSLSEATNQREIPSEPQENFVMNSLSSEESLVEFDPSSSREGLNLSASEDELSLNESQPLIVTNT